MHWHALQCNTLHCINIHYKARIHCILTYIIHCNTCVHALHTYTHECIYVCRHTLNIMREYIHDTGATPRRAFFCVWAPAGICNVRNVCNVCNYAMCAMYVMHVSRAMCATYETNIYATYAMHAMHAMCAMYVRSATY